MPEDQNIPEEQSTYHNRPPSEANENISQEQTIEETPTSNIEPQTENIELHHHPDLHQKEVLKEYTKKEGAEFVIEVLK